MEEQLKSDTSNNIYKISILNMNIWFRVAIGLFILSGGGVLSYILFRSQFPVLGYILAGIVLIILIHLLGEFHYLIIDLAGGIITWKRGIIFTTSSKNMKIKDVTGILQEKEIHSSKNNSIIYYVAKFQFKGKQYKRQKSSLSLETSINPEKGEFFKSRNQFKTRKIAEELAEVLKRPLVDKTRIKTTIRPWNELNMSIAEKWSREEKKTKKPSVPDFMLERIDEVTIDGISSTSIQIPSFIKRYPKVLFIFIPLIFSLSAFIAYQSWNTKDISEALSSDWVIGSIIILIVATVFFLKGLTSKKVRINENQINILYKYAVFLPWIVKLDSSEIEEVDFTGNTLELVTDKRIVSLIDHGQKGETKFCLDMIKYTLKPPSYSL